MMSSNSNTSCGLESILAQANTLCDVMENAAEKTAAAAGNRRRRVSSSALYEVRRTEINEVCYLFVPDEYVSSPVLV